MSKNPAYGLNLTFLFLGILKIAMIGFVIYCISIILLMIDSFCQKISGSMLLPYVFLQSIMGITLLACSIILNLIFTVLRYPHWNFDNWIMLFIFAAVIVVFKKKSPYVAGLFSLIYLGFLTILSTYVDMSILTTFNLPLPLIWCLLKIKKTYEFLDKATSLEKSE